jgi:cation:H+ antiporter
MELILNFILMFAGFILLIKGADWLVKGASSFAKKLAISEIVIGLTIVSLGTSAPELFVNIFAGLQDKADLAFGNIIGSNIANTLLVLGVAGLFGTIKSKRGTVWIDIPLSLLAALVLLSLCNDLLNEKSSVLSQFDGAILLTFFAAFLYYTFTIAKKGISQQQTVESVSTTKAAIFLFFGMTCLFLGGRFVVDYAVKIAETFGMSEKLIGFTIVSIGTSLPEVVTSAVAAKRGRTDIAIGNVVGSNLLNIFFVLGLSATIAPLTFDPVINVDIFVLISASLILFAVMFIGKRFSLGKREAVFFLLIYFSYVIYLICRN